jgi:hypothetical protein
VKLGVIILAKRRPPVLTINSFDIGPPVYVITDPDVYQLHVNAYEGNIHDIHIVNGARGIGQQTAFAYEFAYKMGWDWWVRLDDDLPKNTFVDKFGIVDDMDYLIDELVTCVEETGTSFAGVANSTNKSWLKEGYSRTYGMIHGGFNIARPAPNGSFFTPLALPRNGDVWRSCAHRVIDGAVGRVQHIGFDKGPSTLNLTTIPDDQASIDLARTMILDEFGGPDRKMVTCDGYREIGGKQFPNWRMARGKVFRAKA